MLCTPNVKSLGILNQGNTSKYKWEKSDPFEIFKVNKGKVMKYENSVFLSKN